jgi:hypothetical protein
MGSLTKKLKKTDEVRRVKNARESFIEGYRAGARETIKFYTNLTNRVETLYLVDGIGEQRYKAVLEHLGFPTISIKESKASGITAISNQRTTDNELGTVRENPTL